MVLTLCYGGEYQASGNLVHGIILTFCVEMNQEFHYSTDAPITLLKIC